MKKIIILAFLIVSINANSQTHLVQSIFLRNYTVPQLSSVYGENEVTLYRIKYKTKDINGNPDTASGAVLFPKNMSYCDSFPLMNYNHGTVFEKLLVPSRMHELEAGLLYASHGYVATMPDYLGMGDSRGIHPYQHAESEAWATVDMIRAARELMVQENITLSGRVFLTGYSQGGHACMATHKYIQDSSLYNEFNVVRSIPMSGAYDMSDITANFIFQNTYDNPGYIVYLINSMQMAYGNLYDSVQQYYKAPYDASVEGWLNGSTTLTSINNSFPDSIHLYLQDSVLQGFQTNPNHPLRLAVAKSNVYAWAPTRRIRMYYCEADEQVPYQNAIKALDTMTARGSTVVTAVSGGATQNHGGCVLPSFVNGFTYVDSVSNRCAPPAGINEVNLNHTITLYPNPASQVVSFESVNKIKSIQAFNEVGKLIYQQSFNGINHYTLDISRVEAGVYFISFIDINNNRINKKLTIQ